MIPHVSNKRNAKSNKDEAWTAFLAEREKILNHCDKLDKQFLFLTGDLHNSFALNISDNIHEYASGPHNSYNHNTTAEGDPLRQPVNSFQETANAIYYGLPILTNMFLKLLEDSPYTPLFRLIMS